MVLRNPTQFSQPQASWAVSPGKFGGLVEDVNRELEQYPSTLPASCPHMHYAVRFIHMAPLLVGFIFPTLQMEKLRDRTKSLVESDSPCLWTWSPRATAGRRGAPVTSPAPFPLHLLHLTRVGRPVINCKSRLACWSPGLPDKGLGQPSLV